MGVFFSVLLNIIEIVLSVLEFLALAASVVTFFVLMLNKYSKALKKILVPLGMRFFTRLRVLVLCRRSPLKKRAFLEFSLLKTGGRSVNTAEWRSIINGFKAFYTDSASKSVYVLSNCTPLIGEHFSRAVQVYFDYFQDEKVKKAFGMKGDLIEWAIGIRIEEAYATPTFLLTGLLARYEENWADFIRRYVSTAYMTETEESDNDKVLSNELYMTFAWLLWGPSYELKHDSYWSGLCQLSFGDESNSVPAIADGRIAPQIAKCFRKNVGRRYGELMSVELTLLNKGEYLRRMRQKVIPDEAYFYERLEGEESSFSLRIDDFHVREGYKSKKYYSTAYVWLLFELEDESRYAFQPKTSLAFFEHANLTDMATYQFLIETLLNKCFLHFASVFGNGAYEGRKYRFVCAMNKDIEVKFLQKYAERTAENSADAQAFRTRLLPEPKRRPANAFAAFDEFFAQDTEYSFEEADAAEKNTITDLACFYADIYMGNFPDANERESFENLLKYLQNAADAEAYKYHIVLVKNKHGTIMAGAIFDYFKRTNCAVVEFIAVRQNLQSAGIGSALYHHILETISKDAFENGKLRPEYVFCEIDAPSHSRAQVKKYLYFWDKYKFMRLNMQYVQPALSGTQKPVKGLWLTVSSLHKMLTKLPGKLVADVIYDYMKYAMGIAEPDRAPEYVKMKQELYTLGEVGLSKLIEHDPV